MAEKVKPKKIWYKMSKQSQRQQLLLIYQWNLKGLQRYDTH
jgi:hypothetical protein